MKKILMIVGSLRLKSFNRQMAAEIEAILSGKAEIAYLDYSGVPFMNQDIEFPAPESVAMARAAVHDADAIWICTPEYNFNIPGVLKNLLDWLSRPLTPDDPSRNSAVKGKIVTISGVAGKSAAVGVRKSLKTLLEIMSMKVVGGEGTGISLTMEAFMSGKIEFSEGDRAALARQAEALLTTISEA